MLYTSLNSDKALIWRIIHHDNLPWVLQHGLHAGNSPLRSTSWVSIGNAELIDKRANHPVPHPPGGLLNDYVPFYFTPFSVMMLNICTGRGGVPRRDKGEIVILVSSLHRIAELNLPFLFSDMHAYCRWANFYSNVSQLDKIDWPLLQRRDFKREEDDPTKIERYQAEALIHRHCPVSGLIGIVCHSEKDRIQAQSQVAAKGLNLPVHARPEWYF